MKRRPLPQSAVDAVMRENPGISGVRAHQIARDRGTLRDRRRHRRSAPAPVESRDDTPLPDAAWITEGGFDAASLAELS